MKFSLVLLLGLFACTFGQEIGQEVAIEEVEVEVPNANAAELSRLNEQMESLNQNVERLGDIVSGMDQGGAADDEESGSTIYRDCQEMYDAGGFTKNGIYTIRPTGATAPFKVCCEVKEDGAWTLIQNRYSGLEPFGRYWAEYKFGFGDLYTEFWLGNEKIHFLTRQGNYKLEVQLGDWEENNATIQYETFSIEDESQKYRLSIAGPSSSPAGDSMVHHNGRFFSTKDNDNDDYRGNCAKDQNGGWWYGACDTANLNGRYYRYNFRSADFGIQWMSWMGTEAYSLKTTAMRIKRSTIF